MLKRTFDLGLALLVLPFFVFLFPFIAILIWLDDQGPIFFVQKRVGYKQSTFSLYKFRTMRQDIGDLPSHVAGVQGITHIGKWLRKTKLDELPQIFNVMRGNMSFVGPRPCLPSQELLIAARANFGVFDVKPGITGLAQVEGLDMSDPLLLASRDAVYCRSVSLVRDIAIVWATFVGKGRGDAAGDYC